MVEGEVDEPKESHVDSKGQPPFSYDAPEIFSFKKHTMDYFTLNGIILRTGYTDKKYWYILVIKELLDNSVDFLLKRYQGSSNEFITVDITKNDSIFYMKIRNSNSKNFPVFENLHLIFDYDMRYSSKQNLHIVSGGMLGDAMKQILALGYVLIHSHDGATAFTNKQWDKPLIIRCNKTEQQVFVNVDKVNQSSDVKIIMKKSDIQRTDTEIELTLPVVDESLDIMDDVKEFCQTYPLPTTDISFKFRLVDKSNHKPEAQLYEYRPAANLNAEELVEVITNPPQGRKAAIKIEYPALHPISTKWNNTSSVHSYMFEEFITRITNVHHQQSTSVYDVLKKTYREASNLGKNPDNQRSVAELMSDINRDKKILGYYHELRNVLGPPKELPRRG